MLSNEIKRLKMKKIKFENLEKKILKLDTYRRITHLFKQKLPVIGRLIKPAVWYRIIAIPHIFLKWPSVATSFKINGYKILYKGIESPSTMMNTTSVAYVLASDPSKHEVPPIPKAILAIWDGDKIFLSMIGPYPMRPIQLPIPNMESKKAASVFGTPRVIALETKYIRAALYENPAIIPLTAHDINKRMDSSLVYGLTKAVDCLRTCWATDNRRFVNGWDVWVGQELHPLFSISWVPVVSCVLELMSLIPVFKAISSYILGDGRKPAMLVFSAPVILNKAVKTHVFASRAPQIVIAPRHEYSSFKYRISGASMINPVPDPHRARPLARASFFLK